jgi:hypothetical protein
MPNNKESLLSVSLSSSEQADEPNIMKEGEEESREGKEPEDCGTVTTKAVSDRKKCYPTTMKSYCRHHRWHHLQSEQTAEHNVVKEGEEGSREGKVTKTDVSKINDCDTVTTEVISDRKK